MHCCAQDSLAVYIPDVILSGRDHCDTDFLYLEFQETDTILLGYFKLEMGKIKEAWAGPVRALLSLA